LTVNIKDPSDVMLSALKRGNVQYVDDFQEDFVLAISRPDNGWSRNMR
jgi:NAD+ synthase